MHLFQFYFWRLWFSCQKTLWHLSWSGVCHWYVLKFVVARRPLLVSWNCDSCQANKSNFLKINLILGQTGQHTPGLSAQSGSVWGMGCYHQVHHTYTPQDQINMKFKLANWLRMVKFWLLKIIYYNSYNSKDLEYQMISRI